jgi:biotin operon repressor
MSAAKRRSFKLNYLKQLRVAHLTHAQYRVLVAIMTYADQDGTNAHPGFARLASECRMSRSTVSKSIKALKKSGWLRETSRGYPSGERRMASVFDLKIPEYLALGEFPGGDTRSVLYTGDESAPLDSKPPWVAMDAGASSGVPPVSNGSLPSNEGDRLLARLSCCPSCYALTKEESHLISCQLG